MLFEINNENLSDHLIRVFTNFNRIQYNYGQQTTAN